MVKNIVKRILALKVKMKLDKFSIFDSLQDTLSVLFPTPLDTSRKSRSNQSNEYQNQNGTSDIYFKTYSE